MSQTKRKAPSIDELKDLVQFTDVHILVMDDDRSVGRMHQLMIERVGFEKVSLVHALEELLMTLQMSLQDKAVDLILMDIKMPGMDGIEISKTLREHDVFREVPIMMLTASPDVDDYLNSFKYGAFDFLRKPVQPMDLITRICTAVRVRRDQEAAQLKVADMARKLAEQEQADLWDPLTGLMNRLGFEKQLARSWRGALKKDEKLALLLLEINDFNKFITAYGEEAADNCVKQVSWVLSEETKAHVFALYQAGCFVVLVQQPEIDDITNLGQTCIDKVSALQIPHLESLGYDFVSISVGGAMSHPLELNQPRQLLSFADQGLFKARVERRLMGDILEIANGEIKAHHVE